jgi:hypothetical protein
MKFGLEEQTGILYARLNMSVGTCSLILARME